MTRIVCIRPEPGASSTVAAGKAAGLAIVAFPLFDVVPVGWEGPDPDAIDALLVGSGNAFRHGGAGLASYRGKPVLAVGESTAAMARRNGFRVELAGDGGLQKVLDMVAKRPLRLLRLAGVAHVPLDLPEGVSVETRVVYDARDLPMGEGLAEVLKGGALVLLHSANAASHLRAECERLGLPLARIRLAALGPRIAEAAGEGWAEVRSAARPLGGALLALAADMCH